MIFGRSKAELAEERKFRADLLAELRQLIASLSALPPVLNAIAGGVLSGAPALPLTLADFAPEKPNG